MTLHDIIHILLINWKRILKITILAAIVIFFYLWSLSPVTYNAPVTVLPPPEGDQISGLGSILSGSGVGDFLTGKFAPGNSQLFIQILKSRTAAEYVVRKNNLIGFYDVESEYEAIRQLQNDLSMDLSKEGVITLSVNVSTGFIPKIFSDTDSIKNLSARISNSFVEALDKINREKVSYRAKRAREYIEGQLNQTKTELDTAEMKLMEFQKENKTISLPEQLTSVIESAAKLKAEIVNTEIEIALLEPNSRPDNKNLLALRKRLNQLQNEYEKFDIDSDDYLLAFSNVPELGMKLSKLIRNVKVKNEVYVLLQQQYYKERIQENRDVPTIDILDEAIPPKKQVSPRLGYNTAVGSVFVLLIVSLFFVIKEKKLSIFNKARSLSI
ncbi:MAG: Wzz/FepE/Etk N-terminal domain-containing protein [Ignavibacteriaceae bacterium]|nr:Wzz/FepE/Etk N-terminal domain-containing protein [Ignavibacteriaceae bacterium]MCU0405398.1 Wzz/FepE/Etk N-terminal domain-containing protein [Ignavibacteriaceae bacterium]MCU0413003.1 Wzz/FepE/Etk N-terminal domain-containing protein [Ignavibacteriaceae bacterium]